VSLVSGGVEIEEIDARARWVVEVAAYAHGWEATTMGVSGVRLLPATYVDASPSVRKH
jgi:hypothetical protein